MKKSIRKINIQALTQFNQTLELANQALEQGQHKPADWFDTPAKRLQWWLDLEPQWRIAFCEAVFMRKNLKDNPSYQPSDEELQFIFKLSDLMICGSGEFRNRNNFADIPFQLTNLSGVQNLTNLIRIECDYNGQIQSLEPVRNLVKLEVLWCDNNRIEDLSPLMALQNLRSISVWNNQIRNIEPLASLLNLRDLTLGLYDEGNPLESIEPIQYMTNLRGLNITKCGVTSLTPLSKLYRLRHLHASYNDIDSIEPVLHLKNLWGNFKGNPRLKPEDRFISPAQRKK